MKKLLITMLALLLLTGCVKKPAVTPEPSPTPTPTPAPTETATPTPAPTPTASKAPSSGKQGEFNELYDQYKNTTDEAERKELLEKIQTIIESAEKGKGN